jgi:hypothetical protein
MNTSRIARVLARQKQSLVTDYLASIALLAGLVTSTLALL